MTVIKTKYYSATNTRGSRIAASANGFKDVISYPFALSSEKAHFEAVKSLVARHDLPWDLSNMGYGSDDHGYYFTFNHSTMGAQ